MTWLVGALVSLRSLILPRNARVRPSWRFIGFTTTRARARRRAPTAPTKNLYFATFTISRQRRIFASGLHLLVALWQGFKSLTDSVPRKPHRAETPACQKRGG